MRKKLLYTVLILVCLALPGGWLYGKAALLAGVNIPLRLTLLLTPLAALVFYQAGRLLRPDRPQAGKAFEILLGLLIPATFLLGYLLIQNTLSLTAIVDPADAEDPLIQAMDLTIIYWPQLFQHMLGKWPLNLLALLLFSESAVRFSLDQAKIAKRQQRLVNKNVRNLHLAQNELAWQNRQQTAGLALAAAGCILLYQSLFVYFAARPALVIVAGLAILAYCWIGAVEVKR